LQWNKKQKRAYHRIKSGVKIAQIKHKKIKHLILTSSPVSAQLGLNICSDFQVLRKRIFRTFEITLPYCMVHTNEGYGVLHVLYYGPYLPQQWLSNNWNDIHKSTYVYIKETPDNVASYITSQYIADQKSSFVRCSWSHNWVCKGFVAYWKHLQYWAKCWNKTLSDILEKWTIFLTQIAFKQTVLTDLIYPP
jgi:hypothetical protein